LPRTSRLAHAGEPTALWAGREESLVPTTTITIRIVSDEPADASKDFTKTVEVRAVRSPVEPDLLAAYLSSEAKKELKVDDNRRMLASVPEFVRTGESLTLQLADLFSDRYFDRMNTYWIWFEIQRTLLRTTALLAEARAYRDLEGDQEGRLAENRILYSIHRRKMKSFDLAVYGLCKVEDLLVRLLFEGLGARIPADLDTSTSGWERKLTWDNFKRALKESKGSPPEKDYNEVRKVLAVFRSRDFERRLVAYRDRITHRLTPSVDYGELNAPIEARAGTPVSDASGQAAGTRWSIGGRTEAPDYAFDQLYDWAARTLRHYMEVLSQLKAAPRFSWSRTS
jgi:hypothetical protein